MLDTLALVFGPRVVAAVLWSLILLSSRLRSLFGDYHREKIQNVGSVEILNK